MKRPLTLMIALLFTAFAMTACGLFGPSEKLVLDKTELSLYAGESEQLSAGGANKVKWTSSDEAVASVHAGTVNAKAAGTAIITASLENGETAACTVTVSDKLIESVSLDVKSTRLPAGSTIQLTATYSPPDATVTELTWSSEDEFIALVDSEGYVTGVSAGTTEIVCTSSNGVEASCTVTVGAPPEAPTSPPTAPIMTEAPTQNETDAGSSRTDPPESSGSGDFIFPDSSTRMLSDSEIRSTLSSQTGTPLSGSFAQDAINEIFARNGYIFRSPSLRSYYESKSWYHENPNFSSAALNEYEQYNIGMLSQY